MYINPLLPELRDILEEEAEGMYGSGDQKGGYEMLSSGHGAEIVYLYHQQVHLPQIRPVTAPAWVEEGP